MGHFKETKALFDKLGIQYSIIKGTDWNREEYITIKTLNCDGIGEFYFKKDESFESACFFAEEDR